MHFAPCPSLHSMQASGRIKGMKDIVESLKKEPKRYISLAEIASKRLMPWARDGRTIRTLLEKDRKGLNLLNARMTGAGSRRRYMVRAENLINYLLTSGPYLMGTVRKMKTNGKGNSRGSASKKAR